MILKFNRSSQLLVILGCVFINLPVGIYPFYGNLAVYTDSYFKFQSGNDSLDIASDWLLSAIIVTSALGILTVDWLVNKLTQRWTHFIALILFDSGLFLSYFAVQHSVALLLITCIICGYSCGIIITVCFKYVSEVVPDNLGTVSAIVSSSFSMGAIVTSYVTTLYINPDNLTPDVHESNMAYFSQTRVLDHVPQVFIVITVGSVILHVIGYLLEQLPYLFPVPIDISMSTCPEFDCQKIQMTSHSQNNELIHILSVTSDKKSYQQSNTSSATNISDDDNIPNIFGSLNTKAVREKGSYYVCDNDKQPLVSLRPKEILKIKAFYLLWISVAVLTYSSLIIMNYYKMFGLLYIADDSFMTTIGSFSALSNSLYRVATGVFIDKTGVKNTLILTLSKNTIFLMFWYITPQLNRWCYFLCCQMLSGVQGTVYCLFPMALLKLCGPDHLATNLGLAMTANVIAGLISPLVFTPLIDNYGWFTLVLSGSSCSFLVLLATIWVMPDL